VSVPILYGISGTPYTEKVRCALHLKGVAYELREPSSPEDIRRWSPETGLLPVIEIDGQRVADSAAILDRIDAVWPEPPLLARDPKTARDQRRLELWVAETFGFYMMRWVARKFGRDESGPKVDDEGHAIGPLARMGLLDEQGQLRQEAYDTSDGGPGPEFERRVAELETMLGDREWFHGRAMSRADLSVYAALFGMYTNRFTGGRAMLARHPKLLAFCDRVRDATRPPGRDGGAARA
jgi:glutathione S-transferase